MNTKDYAVYIRVSTKKQGASGLGLESQRRICGSFIAARNGVAVAEFSDVESGTHRDRKGLLDAIDYCKRNGCALVIAKLDRLARDVEFCFRVVNTGIEIHFCDMPQINTLLLGVFAAVAQYERELTSDRTKKALAAKKERGEVTGGASEKWAESFAAKSHEQVRKEFLERGTTRTSRYTKSRDVQAFLRILRNIFPTACGNDDVTMWDWSSISTRGDFKYRIINMMKDYRELDNTLFAKWDFERDDVYLQKRISSNMENIRKSYKRQALRQS